MKNLKLGVVAFAALGLVLLLSDFAFFKMMLRHPFAEGAYGLCIIGGFVLALVVGLMGLTKPPFKQAQAIVALVGFALPAIKVEIWKQLAHISHVAKDTKGLLFLIAIVGGIVVSALAAAKPEAQ